eukprot:TRINITY_DN15619_c0_g1_i1.p1 TRINITY_DN15619_c0_g1~~TRINITY_DN15619_c0_g1_i1.p1  ORF type:complete len:146 (-),score=11.16 TRINITY_DN15619_c0_g1_i1:107-544(-)
MVHSLIQDPVAKVRRAALTGVGKVIDVLKDTTDKKKQFLEKIEQLAVHESYQYRIVFSKICPTVVNSLNAEEFESHFLCHLLKLYRDKVPNTRIAAAEALNEICKIEKYGSDSRILDSIEILKTDTDRDVVLVVGGIPPKRIVKQ